MNSDRVLLLELRERTSAAGNRYLSGWLGKASVLAFLDRDADEPTWQVFVSTPAPRGDADSDSARPHRARATRQRQPRRPRQSVPSSELNDSLDDLASNEGFPS